MSTKISATVRKDTGKQASRKYRNGGFVPTNLIVTDQNESILLLTKYSDIRKIYNSQEHFLELDVEGVGTKHAHVKEIQWDNIKDRILHVDLIEVKMDREITAAVSLNFKGKPVGAEKGGVFNTHVTEVEVFGFPNVIPSMIDVDTSKLEIGDHINVSDIKIPANLKLLTRGDLRVCEVHVAARAKVKEEVAAEAAEGEAGAAPAAAPAKGADKK